MQAQTSIVVSGEYQDDCDDGDHLVYTGQGGNDLLGNKRQRQDQVLKTANLALARNAEYCVPVRLIRNHTTPQGRELVYDGLYDVKSYRKVNQHLDFATSTSLSNYFSSVIFGLLVEK